MALNDTLNTVFTNLKNARSKKTGVQQTGITAGGTPLTDVQQAGVQLPTATETPVASGGAPGAAPTQAAVPSPTPQPEQAAAYDMDTVTMQGSSQTVAQFLQESSTINDIPAIIQQQKQNKIAEFNQLAGTNLSSEDEVKSWLSQHWNTLDSDLRSKLWRTKQSLINMASIYDKGKWEPRIPCSWSSAGV